MIGRNWRDTIVAIGKEHSDLGATLDAGEPAHPELHMTAIDDRWPEERFYFRSDHYNFARKGVPDPVLLQRGPSGLSPGHGFARQDRQREGIDGSSSCCSISAGRSAMRLHGPMEPRELSRDRGRRRESLSAGAEVYCAPWPTRSRTSTPSATRMNDLILGAGNLTINRFFALDNRAYEPGRARRQDRRRCWAWCRPSCSAATTA